MQLSSTGGAEHSTIVQVKTVRASMNQSCKSCGIIQEDFLTNSKKYDEYIEEKKKSGFVSPNGQGVLIWDETKVIIKINDDHNFLWCRNSSIMGYAVSSEELASLHDIYEELDSTESSQKTTYELQFLWRDLTSSFDAVGPFFSLSGSIDCQDLYSMVVRTMLAFHEFNFHVRALLCDGASSNLSLLKVLRGLAKMIVMNRVVRAHKHHGLSLLMMDKRYF